MNQHLPAKTLTWTHQPSRELVRLAWPMVISLLSVTVASLLDTLFVGRFGAAPLAAVGLGGVATFTVISFGLAVFAAAKVKVGEALGRGDLGSVKRTLGVFLRLALPLSFVSLLVGCLVAFVVLPSLGGDPATTRLAGQYTAIRSLSFPGVLVVAAVSNWLQGQGQPRAPMLAALIGTAVHVPLNAWFLFGLDGGVVGLAWATVLSQLVETSCLLLFLRTRNFGIRAATFAEAWWAFRVGVATGLERVLDMAAFAAVPILLTQLGPVAVASHQITLQLCHLSFLPLIAIGEGASILVSQAVGAGQRALVWSVARTSLLLAMVYAAALAALLLGARNVLVPLFTGDPAVQREGAATLAVAAALQFINAPYNVLKGVLRGLSVFRYVAQVTVGVAWVVTPPLTYVIGVRLHHGAPGAWFVLCVEVSIGTSLLAYRLLQQRAALSVKRPTSSS